MRKTLLALLFASFLTSYAQEVERYAHLKSLRYKNLEEDKVFPDFQYPKSIKDYSDDGKHLNLMTLYETKDKALYVLLATRYNFKTDSIDVMDVFEFPRTPDSRVVIGEWDYKSKREFGNGVISMECCYHPKTYVYDSKNKNEIIAKAWAIYANKYELQEFSTERLSRKGKYYKSNY